MGHRACSRHPNLCIRELFFTKSLFTPARAQDPRTDLRIAYWDLVTTIALLYTATVTPYEVAFLQSPPMNQRWTNNLFLTNRCTDVIFIIDLLLQFRTAYKSTDPIKGTEWHTNPRKIAINYLTSSWFYLDVFSILTSLFDIVGGDDTKDLIVLRAVRVLRLAKLIRLARGSRIFKKWEMNMSINYAYLSLIQIFAGILIGCHWFSCLWGLEASFDPLGSWPSQKDYCVPWELDNQSFVEAGYEVCIEERSGRNCDKGICDGEFCTGGYECVDPFQMYSFSLYFAVMTITSVGYGDIVAEPFNVTEQMICSFIILSSGMLWGYLIGTFCGLAAASSPQKVVFREELSSLNTFMTENQLPKEMRFRLREYLFEAVHLSDSEVRKRILAKLSPSMQLEVSWQINSRWVHMVWYLSDAEATPEKLIIDLAMCLKALVFPPREMTPPGFLYILDRGSAFWGGKMQRAGAVWGEDIVLQNEQLQLSLPALCATYVCVYTIGAEALLDSINKYPEFKERFRLVRLKWTVRRAIVRAAEFHMHRQGLQFRGRLRPIYAKKLAAQIDEQQLARTANSSRPMTPTKSPVDVARSPSKGLIAIPGMKKTPKTPNSSKRTPTVDRHAKEIEVATLHGALDLRVKQMTSDLKLDTMSEEGRPGRRGSVVATPDPIMNARLYALESKLGNIEQLLMRSLAGKPLAETDDKSPSPSFRLTTGSPPTLTVSVPEPRTPSAAGGALGDPKNDAALLA